MADRFELVKHKSIGGVDGYYFIHDNLYNKPVLDENGFLIFFDIEEEDEDYARQEGEQFIRRNHKQLAELMDERENA